MTTLDRLDELLSSRGHEHLDELCREVAQGTAVCQKCKEKGSLWDDGTKSEWYGDIARKKLGGIAPFDCKATCVVWQRDERVMVDLSRCEPSCDYHISFRPWWGENYKEVYVEREILWSPKNEGFESAS